MKLTRRINNLLSRFPGISLNPKHLQVRFPGIHLLRTGDPGCCVHQAAIPWGWRLILANRWFIDFGAWKPRHACGGEDCCRKGSSNCPQYQ